MKEIPLTQGQVALVDDEDFERVRQHKWTAHQYRGKHFSGWHARRSGYYVDGKRIRQGMHSFILNTSCLVDHKDLNGLNNQKDNLRPADRNKNQANKRTHAHSSNFKGVSWMKNEGFWQAYISCKGQRFYLGAFKNEIDAALAYDAAALNYFGEFALTNQQLGLL